MAQVVDRVRGDEPGRGPRWVDLDGLHLTLRFLGATPEDRRPEVEAAVREAVAGQNPFPVELSGGGAFPSPGRPRTLWIGVSTGIDGLTALARAFDAALASRGWPPDGRPFRGHLTLARTDGVRGGPGAARALVVAASDFHVGWMVDRIVLFESRLGRGPAVYEPLLEVPLAG